MPLPIDSIGEEIRAAASRPGFCVLLSAPTGSGKSTRVPILLRQAGIGGQEGMILVVQPRRLAAQLLAAFVARTLPCPLGAEVGYTVRFDSRRSAETRILFITDGILERMMTAEPTLPGVAAIVFDEMHERRLAGDLCLARALELQRGPRPELGLFIMSATLELDKLSAYLPQATVLRAEGRCFPVEVEYRQPVPVRDARGFVAPPPVWVQCAAAIKDLVSHPDCGDVLVFLPGVGEINRTAEHLRGVGWLRGWDVLPLHSRLTPQAQAAAVEPADRPRVILSTDIAETSLTLPGVRSVVDSGCAREARQDPRRGIATLHIVPISQARAEQRTGRAGRLAPGRCIRLWSRAEHNRRPPFPSPEVHRADVSQAFLSLLAWGYHTPAAVQAFPWPDAPTEQQSQAAWQLLESLGALAPQGGLSPIGRAMLAYPLPPVLSRLLVSGQQSDCAAEAAAIAALIQEESVALATGLAPSFVQEGDFSDFQAEWRAVLAAEQLRFDPTACSRLGILARGARAVLVSFRRLAPRGAVPDFPAHREAICAALLASFPSSVAVRNTTATHTARLPEKRSGTVVSPLASQADLFLAADITEVGGKKVETRLSRCTILPRDLLPTVQNDVPAWDAARKRVLFFRQSLYRDLVLDAKELGDAPKSLAAPILADQILRGNLPLPAWDAAVCQWLNRLACLRAAMPELELPDFSEDDRRLAITLLCEGAVAYKDILNRSLLPILADWLSPLQRDALQHYAPTSLTLENGRSVKLVYDDNGTPAFSLKCQLLFGTHASPTVAAGRVPCLIHILAPNQRPYQLTSDLPSFWKNGYPQMKKDLAGRYPRHHWPDSAP
ncbi:MAG: ATP-dependent helicase HrpB [Akkermansia sp.]